MGMRGCGKGTRNANVDPSSPNASSSGAEDEITAEWGTNAPAVSHIAPAQEMSDDRCKACFQRRLRMLIEGPKKFAKGIKYDPTEQGSTYPISYSFWFLLCRVSTDDLMESYMVSLVLSLHLAMMDQHQLLHRRLHQSLHRRRDRE